jgi:hypothetical protein
MLLQPSRLVTGDPLSRKGKGSNMNIRKITCMFIAALLFASIAYAESFKLHKVRVSEENIVEIKKMTLKEKDYLVNKLGKIRKSMSRNEVFAILGPPSRDLPQKANWWVRPDRKNIRAGVYFMDNQASEVVLDGGAGSFYYRQKL